MIHSKTLKQVKVQLRHWQNEWISAAKRKNFHARDDVNEHVENRRKAINIQFDDIDR